MFDFKDYESAFETWLAALTNPAQFLSQPFAPSPDEFTAGIEFYLHVLVASVAIYGLIIVFIERGSLAIKARMLANALLGAIMLFVIAAVMHFPFWVLGGQATFAGTLLTNIYAGTPYGPLTAIGMLVFIAGMPAELRRLAINPATAKQASQIASKDPQTDKFTFFAGSAIIVGLMFWTLFVTFRYLSYSHDVHGWRLAVAILACLIISVPLNKISQRMAMFVSGGVDSAVVPATTAGPAPLGGSTEDETG
jgi:hypothetical protein